MQIGNARLVLTKEGNDVPVKGITPAEAMFLHILHSSSNGGKTFGEKMGNIEVVGEAMVETPERLEKVKNDKGVEQEKLIPAGLRPRTDAEELGRLSRKYDGARTKENKPIINDIWPDRFNPKLPQKFSDVKWVEASAAGIETAPLNFVTGNVKTTL